MIAMLKGVCVGTMAAMRTPLWIRGPRIKNLLEPWPGRESDGSNTQAALAAMRLVIRVLGRTPLFPWKNTCLYRCIAECLVLRSYGIGCRLRLGVDRDSTTTDLIHAHAWVVRGDESPGEPSHVVLRPST